MLANCWRQIELVSILANFFANFFVLANSNLTCERLANVCCYLSTNQNTHFSHVICVTLHKMADEDRDATFKFIEEIHNNPAVWDVSSPSYKDTNLKQKIFKRGGILDESIVHAKGGISGNIRLRPNQPLSPTLPVLSPAFNTK